MHVSWKRKKKTTKYPEGFPYVSHNQSRIRIMIEIIYILNKVYWLDDSAIAKWPMTTKMIGMPANNNKQ